MDLAYSTRRRIVAFVAGCAVMAGLTTTLSAQSTGSAGHGKALIVSEIHDAERTQLRGNIVPLGRGMVDQGAAPDDLQLDKMILVLKRSAEKQTALDRLVAAQQNSHSPSYHRWLSPESFGDQFGADPQDVAQLTSWLVSHGFRVDSVSRNRSVLQFSGTNGQLQQAFQTSMHLVKDSVTGKLHYDARTEPTLPSALVPAVAGFARLSNIPFKPMHVDYGLVRRNRQSGQWTLDRAETDGKSGSIKPNLNIQFSSTYHAVGPYDFAAIYNVKSLWDAGIDGTGQKLAVVAKSDIDPDDITNFRKNFNIPDGGSVNVVYAGPEPGYTDSEGEAALDAEWSGAIAPKANIYVVTSDDTVTTDGLFLDFLYAIDNNLAPVLSVSWGSCELGISADGDTYISGLWEQASAQGITVLVSSGDAGSAACDQNSSYASYGMQVNGMASTHFDTAVGGTDLYGTYTDPTRYWAASNDPTTLQSALSYISEVPWNDSCGNPLVLAANQKKGSTDATMEALCNDSALQAKVLNTGGGGGGASNCTVHDGSDPSTCSGGYTKPEWQSGLTGIPDDGVRDLPDISFFSGDGVWGSFYVYCLSSASPTGTCHLTDPNDVQYMAAGGTSFAAPAFAGAIALLNQKTRTTQGLINPVLYKLATQQAASSDGLSKCDGSVGADDSSCIFHDVTLGSISMPCASGSANCVVNDPEDDSYGLLPGWSANAGYDLASGIGSANIANLVNNWSTASNFFNASATTLSAEQNTFSYGQDGGGSVTVTAAAGVTGQPSGDVSVVSDNFGNGPFTLSSGKASYSILGLSPGTHSVTARYAGDGSFAASVSDATSITVVKADSALTLTSSRSGLKYGESLTLTATLSSTSKANPQTGALVFTNRTTGQTLGSVAVQAINGASVAAVQGSLTVSGSQLTGGTNQLAVSYAGDGNYNATAPATVTASYTSAFSLTTTGTGLRVPAGGSASLNLALASNSGALQSNVAFACPSDLPSGLSCVFSPAVLPSGLTTAATTLTVYSSNLLSAGAAMRASSMPPIGTPLIAMGCLGAGVLFLRRCRALASLFLLVLVTGTAIIGCGGNASALKATDVTLSVSSPSVAMGSSLGLTASVIARNGEATPQGTVTFYQNGQQMGTGVVNAGTASMNTSTLSVGDHAITAVYGGGSGYDVSSSAQVHADVTYSYNLTVAAKDGNGNSSAVTVPVTVY